MNFFTYTSWFTVYRLYQVLTRIIPSIQMAREIITSMVFHLLGLRLRLMGEFEASHDWNRSEVMLLRLLRLTALSSWCRLDVEDLSGGARQQVWKRSFSSGLAFSRIHASARAGWASRYLLIREREIHACIIHALEGIHAKEVSVNCYFSLIFILFSRDLVENSSAT